MARTCVMVPQIKNAQGQMVESKLFRELTSFTQDRTSAVKLWGFTKMKFFQESFPDIEKDENGEPTIEALNKVFDITKLLENTTDLSAENKELRATKDGNPVLYDNIYSLIPRVTEFNNTHESTIATIVRRGDQYMIQVSHKNADSQYEHNKFLFNQDLNNKLLGLVRQLGFDVSVDSHLETNGVFDPIDAMTTAKGLKTIIKISTGIEAEESFPEEFSHMMIEGLHANSLVQRALNLLNNDELVQAVLGDSYDWYSDKYHGNKDMLKKEAAGHLLASYIKNQSMNSEDAISARPLMERIWNDIKSRFSTISEQNIDQLIAEANDTFAQLANAVQSEDILEEVDKEAIEKASTFYSSVLHVEDKTNKLESLAKKGLELSYKRYRILISRMKNNKDLKADVEAIHQIRDLIKQQEYASSCYAFLSSVERQLSELAEDMKKLSDPKAYRRDSKLSKMSRKAQFLRKVQEFSSAYEGIVKDLKHLKEMKEDGLVDLLDDDISEMRDLAIQVDDLMESLHTHYTEKRAELVTEFLSLYYTDSEITMGENKGQILSMEIMLKHAFKDISFVNKVINSLSDCGDPLLGVIDKAVKVTHKTRDRRISEALLDIRAAHQKLISSGNSTAFMNEVKNGHKTGRLICSIKELDKNGNPTGERYSLDFDRYTKERKEFIESVKAENLHWKKSKEKIKAWDKEHSEKVLIHEGTDRVEIRPSRKYYKLPAPKLNAAQQEYYDTMMEIKNELDSFLPERKTKTFNSIYVRKDTWESITSSIDDPSKVFGILSNKLKNEFLTSVDDLEYGDRSDIYGGLEEDDVQTIRGIKTELGLDNEMIQRLPIFYTTPLDDADMISDDFTSSMVAYTAMAVNYDEMNKVIDALELTRDLVMDRPVIQTSGDLIKVDQMQVGKELIQEIATTPGRNTNIGERLNQYFDMVVYGHMKGEPTIWSFEFNEKDVNIDVSKMLDNLKAYTGALGLGLNPFSGISNITVGKMQHIIDGFAGEYFNLKDLAKATTLFYKYLLPYINDIGSAQKTSFLSLLIDKYDILGDFHDKLKREGYYDSKTGKIIGNANIFIMQNIGEIYLHVIPVLAMLGNHKKYSFIKNGDKSKVYSLLEVLEESQKEFKDSSGNLIGKKLLSTGARASDVSDPEEIINELRDAGYTLVDGSTYTTEMDIDNQLFMGKVNKLFNGSFEDVDKGVVHKNAVTRLMMQFRQWMPEHYNRRYQKALYDAELNEWREGFYRTTGRFIFDCLKDVARFKFEVATRWNSLNDKEKANIKRAIAEVGMYIALGQLIGIFAGWRDKNSSYWKRMFVYQMHRMKMETAASCIFMPKAFIDNAITLLNSPAASIASIQHIEDGLSFWNINKEIQSGRFEGWSVWERDVVRACPIVNQWWKGKHFANDNFMFNMFDVQNLSWSRN